MVNEQLDQLMVELEDAQEYMLKAQELIKQLEERVMGFKKKRDRLALNARDAIEEIHKENYNLKSRLAVYERAAEVFVRYQLAIDFMGNTELRGVLRNKNPLNADAHIAISGKTPEEALSNALKEVENVD